MVNLEQIPTVMLRPWHECDEVTHALVHHWADREDFQKWIGPLALESLVNHEFGAPIVTGDLYNWVAFDDGQPVAFLSATRSHMWMWPMGFRAAAGEEPTPEGPAMWFSTYVDPNRRGRRYSAGAKLAAIENSAAAGVKLFLGFADAENTASRRALETAGFCLAGTAPDREGKDQCYYWLRRADA
ncbi:GNAT family N-acetyltransferase [Nocardia sp. NPDC004860]|uniref:GNAT family N-acetyltransferase n=1 Tax=Nocardia sp. NPDC004860 TaxID=3154557 RepID=UPI0033B5020B